MPGPNLLGGTALGGNLGGIGNLLGGLLGGNPGLGQAPSGGGGFGDALGSLLSNSQFTVRSPKFNLNIGDPNRRIKKKLEELLISSGVPNTTEPTTDVTTEKNQQGDTVSSLFPMGINPMTVRGPRFI